MSSIQRGKEEYKLAATSDGMGKKDKAKKDMDELKKEVDLVSRLAVLFVSSRLRGDFVNHLFYNDRNTCGSSWSYVKTHRNDNVTELCFSHM